MKKNVRSYVEQPEFSEPQCLLDMNDYQLIEVGGLVPDLKHKKSAHMTAYWKPDSRPSARLPIGDSDLSGFRFLTFSAFSVNGAGGSFVLRFESDSREDGKSGYFCTLPVTQNGSSTR